MDPYALLRRHPRVALAMSISGALLCGGLVILESFAPMPPWRQEVVGVLRSEWAALPPVRGSTVVRTNLTAGFIDPNINFQVDYASSGSCAEVQAHYATAAPAAGWMVQHPLRSFHQYTPPLEALETTYRKYVRTFTVSLAIDCFVEESGYSVFVDSPPTD